MKPAWEVLETSGRVWRWDGRWEQSEEGLGEVLVRPSSAREADPPGRRTTPTAGSQVPRTTAGEVIGCGPACPWGLQSGDFSPELQGR